MSNVALKSYEFVPQGIHLVWSDDLDTVLHPLWLRDNCPSGGDKSTSFRTFSLVDLDPTLDIEHMLVGKTEITIEFTDGHTSQFDLGWLHDNCPAQRQRRPRKISTFRRGSMIPTMAIPATGSREHTTLLESVARWGGCVVTGVPAPEAGTERLASLIGHVRETDFGRLFDIVMEPEAWTPSQSGQALAPHTDDPYRYTPSGVSILHCIQPSSEGGDSLLVDGFQVAQRMRDLDPQGFNLLTQESVPYVRHRTETADQGEDVYLLAHAPVIALDRDGEISGVRFHERSMAPLDVNPDRMQAYYRALIAFATMVGQQTNTLQLKLLPGQALVYDNQRLLHGRTAFTADSGRRHLRLCTIDRDQFHSRLRRLRETHGLSAVLERLPPGNLS